MSDFEFVHSTELKRPRGDFDLDFETSLKIDLSKEATEKIQTLLRLSKKGKATADVICRDHFLAVLKDFRTDEAANLPHAFEAFLRASTKLSKEEVPAAFEKAHQKEMRERLALLVRDAQGKEKPFLKTLDAAIEKARETQAPKPVKLPADRAFDYYMQEKLRISVDNKFYTDHIVKENLSAKQAESAAIERFRRNPKITTSSWISLPPSTVINKAASATKMAKKFGTEQQMAFAINAEERVVTLHIVEPKRGSKEYDKSVEVDKGQRAIIKSEEKKRSITVVGPWDPLTGDVSIYHYEAKGMPTSHEFQAKYLEFLVDGDGDLAGPTAT